MILYVMLIEFYAVRNLGYADAFVCGVHCGKLLIAHLNRAETKAVVGNIFIVTAVCTACHKIRNNACFGIAFVKTFFKVTEFFTVPVNAV